MQLIYQWSVLKVFTKQEIKRNIVTPERDIENLFKTLSIPNK